MSTEKLQINAGTKTFRSIECFFKAICILCVFAMALVMCWDVLFRYIFISPLAWAQEVIQFLMAILFSAGLPIVALRHEHIVVDVFSARFKGATARTAAVFVHTVTGAFMALLSYSSGQFAIRQTETSDSTDWLKIPWSYATWAISCSSAVVALICIAMAVAVCRGTSR